MPSFRRTIGLLAGCGLFSATMAQAQRLTGQVVAAATAQPVPFAAVGVKGKSVGTTADETGRFAFTPPASVAASDSVIISCIGFRPLGLTVAQLQQPITTWTLQPLAQRLQEVQVRHGKLRPAILGRTAENGVAHWTTKIRDVAAVGADERGWEITTILPVPRSCYLDAFHVYIEQNGFRPVRLRFMLYAVEDGKPQRQLLTDDIQFTIPQQQTGWTSVELSSYNIHLPKGQTVAAGIQWLAGEKLSPASPPLSGPGAFPSALHRAALRDKSEADWRILPANLSMYLDVQQY